MHRATLWLSLCNGQAVSSQKYWRGASKVCVASTHRVHAVFRRRPFQPRLDGREQRLQPIPVQVDREQPRILLPCIATSTHSSQHHHAIENVAPYNSLPPLPYISRPASHVQDLASNGMTIAAASHTNHCHPPTQCSGSTYPSPSPQPLSRTIRPAPSQLYGRPIPLHNTAHQHRPRQQTAKRSTGPVHPGWKVSSAAHSLPVLIRDTDSRSTVYTVYSCVHSRTVPYIK